MSLTDLPGIRVPWDVDGSYVIKTTAAGAYVNDLTEEERRQLNAESQETVNSGSGYIVVVFAQPWDLAACWFYGVSSSFVRNPQYSFDTTNGSDGAWTAVPGGDDPAGWANYNVLDPVISDVRGIRYGADSGSIDRDSVRGMHAYGTPSTPEGLELWSPSADELLTESGLNLGLVYADLTYQAAFRVKNTNATDTAEAVTVTRESRSFDAYEALTEFSDDAGATWQTSLALGDLAPSTISGELLVRLSPTSSVPPGRALVRILADAASWLTP